MADSSLDDFFAKKDKSKKKSKSKTSPTDALSKADEGSKREKKKKDKEQPGGLGLNITETIARKRAVRKWMKIATCSSQARLFQFSFKKWWTSLCLSAKLLAFVPIPYVSQINY